MELFYITQELKMLKIIKPKIKKLVKGNIYKYNNKISFFQKGIKDIYLTEVILNRKKVDKLKSKDTLFFILKGKVDLLIKKNNKFLVKKIDSKNKNFYLIKKGVVFNFKNRLKEKAIIMSFLNEKY